MRRAPSPDIDASAPGTAVLPTLEDAEPGGFDRESFLRALVVQHAQAVQYEVHPETAAQLLARVRGGRRFGFRTARRRHP